MTQITTNGNRSGGHRLTIVAGSTMESSVTLIGGKVACKGLRARRKRSRGRDDCAGSKIRAERRLFRRDQAIPMAASACCPSSGDYHRRHRERLGLELVRPGVIAHYVERGRKSLLQAQTQSDYQNRWTCRLDKLRQFTPCFSPLCPPR